MRHPGRSSVRSANGSLRTNGTKFWMRWTFSSRRSGRTKDFVLTERIFSDVATLDAETLHADAALVTMVLHHPGNPRGVLHGVARMVSPGGRVVVAEFHPNGPGQVGPPREQRLRPDVVTHRGPSTE